jgi:hypothetical protein
MYNKIINVYNITPDKIYVIYKIRNGRLRPVRITGKYLSKVWEETYKEKITCSETKDEVITEFMIFLRDGHIIRQIDNCENVDIDALKYLGQINGCQWTQVVL